MRLLRFQVTKFRNVVDSGPIDVDPAVTCLVGKNEAGKSALIEALYLFNPAYEVDFEVEDQYPRWLAVSDRRSGELREHAPIVVTIGLDPEDKQAVNSVLGEGVLTADEIVISKSYGGKRTWNCSWNEAVAIQNLIKALPHKIQPLLKDSDTLDKFRENLKNISSSQSEGDVPTSEEIAQINQELEARGLEKSVWNAIVNKLSPRLPCFFRFTSYNTLPGRIDFQDLANAKDEGPGRSDLQTARALLKLAGTDLDQLGNEDYELRRGELEAVQIDLTRQVFEYWKQNPELEVNIDVDKENVKRGDNITAVARYLDIRLRDKRTGYSNNFSQRSSGFQWFFSFLAAFSEFEEKASPIVLLDEPALTLHGKAQADFLRFINERLNKTPVIYTTHSPFMVEANRLDRVRIIEDKGPPTGAIASMDVLAANPDSLFPLQAALGYDIAQNLFVGPHNLVVEGTSEYIYLIIMSQICLGAGKEPLDPRWRIIPAGGATNIPTFVSLIGPHLDITVLADSNAQGVQRINNMVSRGLLAGHRLILANVGTEAQNMDIEDLFTEGDYLKLYNKTYSQSLKVADLPKGDRIVRRLESKEGSFDHRQVAETLLRNHHEISFSETTVNRFTNLINKINQTIGK